MTLPFNGAVLRLLDANANRAREALRVLEDYARFVLNDQRLSQELRQVRHELMRILQPVLHEAILHRDTPGDVGTHYEPQSALKREGLADVVTAAGKRLGEALRAIEEYFKTVNPDEASDFEKLRYRFYDVEQHLARTLCATKRFANVRLYVLITEKVCTRPWLRVAEQALLGGADCLQLREKELSDRDLLHRAKQLVELCRRHEKLCIINDRPDIVLLSDADGVHVGQEDLPATQCRKVLGPQKIVGVSTHNMEQAKRAVTDGAEYIGVGPIFTSSTKPRDFVAGLDFARQSALEISIPTVAIAGITAANLDQVLATGIRAIAVTAAVCGADDPREAAAELKASVQIKAVS